jgi:hypothetical protein
VWRSDPRRRRTSNCAGAGSARPRRRAPHDRQSHHHGCSIATPVAAASAPGSAAALSLDRSQHRHQAANDTAQIATSYTEASRGPATTRIPSARSVVLFNH